MPTADEFRDELRSRLRAGRLRNLPYVDINAGELHRQLGGYPGNSHRMPNCCQVMQAQRQTGDTVISSPLSGMGASLTIRYRLPR